VQERQECPLRASGGGEETVLEGVVHGPTGLLAVPGEADAERLVEGLGSRPSTRAAMSTTEVRGCMSRTSPT
jgi:hypothetical protein